MVTASLARNDEKQGFSVGILDADYYRTVYSEDVGTMIQPKER